MKMIMLTSGTIHATLSHRLLQLARQFAKAGHEVTIIAPSRDKYSDFKPDTPAAIDGVRCVYPAQFQTQNYLLNLLPYVVSSLWHVLTRPADLVYIYKPTPITVTGLAAKWRRRTKIVLDMDDLGSEVMRAEGRSAILCQLVELCEHLCARHAHALIAASRLLQDQFQRQFPHKPVLRLSNGVNPDEFPVSRAKRPPRLIFFGALGRTRLVGPILEALPEVIKALGKDNVHLDILGDGRSRPDLEQTARRLGIEKHVTFHGWTTFTQLQERTAAGDIGLCIMPQERTTAACSNQKVFQYMSLELCTVATDVGDLPLYVENGRAGVVVSSNQPAQLAAALTSLLQDPSRRAALAKRGRILAETTYSWETLARRVETFLAPLLTSPGEKQ